MYRTDKQKCEQTVKRSADLEPNYVLKLTDNVLYLSMTTFQRFIQIIEIIIIFYVGHLIQINE